MSDGPASSTSRVVAELVSRGWSASTGYLLYEFRERWDLRLRRARGTRRSAVGLRPTNLPEPRKE